MGLAIYGFFAVGDIADRALQGQYLSLMKKANLIAVVGEGIVHRHKAVQQIQESIRIGQSNGGVHGCFLWGAASSVFQCGGAIDA